MTVPASRIRRVNDHAVDPEGDFVLYWMITTRRTRRNFGLQRAVERCLELRKPLVILEALRCDYPAASDRIHQFILDGMRDNARALRRTRALYFPYVEQKKRGGRGLIRAIAGHACAIVTDWFPATFVPSMIAAAAAQCAVSMEAVDSNGLIPLSAHGKAFPVARSYRAFVQRELRQHLRDMPDEAPVAVLRGFPRLTRLPAAITDRWPPASAAMLRGGARQLSQLPIDHQVEPVALTGGATAASAQLDAFVESSLARYADDHNHPDLACTSRLSPYLHFGHLSPHDIFESVATHERWTTRKLSRTGGGRRDGWWGMSASAEAFLDQVVVWRELAYNTCEYVADYHSWKSLPEWARRTLDQHAPDPRPHLYSLTQLEQAATADDVWNAAQRQMVAEGWFHGYLRMLWGKKILEWTPTPAAALERMAMLMDKYSLDGRDPNSYAGYAWVLGRYDRPWPERPIFGTVRYMTSASARRKLRMKAFLRAYGP